MPTPAVATTSIIFICPECGIIQKSGKLSCCGRGGSWFGNCGSVGEANLDHTWHEGIQACKTRQFQSVAGHQLEAYQAKSNSSSDDASDMSIGSNTEIVAMSKLMTGVILINAPANTSTVTPTHTSVACNDGVKSFKTVTTTSIRLINTAMSVSPPKTTMLPDDGASRTIAKPMRSTSTDMLVMTASHASVSVSFIAREWEKAMYAVICISLIIHIVCWD